MNRRIHLILLALVAFMAPAAAQNISVTAQVDSVELAIGEQTDLVIQVKMGAKQQAQFPLYTDTLVTGVEVLDRAPMDTLYTDSQERVTLTQRYKITSFEEKLYLIPPIPIVVDGDTILSDPLSLKVMVPFDLSEAKEDEFFGPKDIMEPPFVWSDWATLFVCLILLVPAILLCIYLVKRAMDNKPIIRRIKLTPEVPPHEEAFQLIEEIKSRKAWQSAGPKAYYTELTDVLRKYMAKRFGFNAMEMTSGEIIEALEQQDDSKGMQELNTLFSTADLVKFAKHNPQINENDANLMNAIDFINETKVLPDPAAKPAPTEKVIVEKRSLRTKLLLGAGVLLTAAAAATCVWYIVKEGADLLRSLF